MACVCVLQKVGNENPNPNKTLVMQSPGKIRACFSLVKPEALAPRFPECCHQKKVCIAQL